MNETPTPRTNASKTRARKNGFSPLIYYCYANDMAKLEYELTAVTDQRDRLAEALQDYMSAFGQGLEAHGIPMTEQQTVADTNARSALATLNQQEP